MTIAVAEPIVAAPALQVSLSALSSTMPLLRRKPSTASRKYS